MGSEILRRMPQVGETLKGRYLLKTELGMGGFAKVFSGDDTVKNRPIAAKVLKLYTAEQILQFSFEAFRMSKLKHPNLMEVLDYSADAGILPYIITYLALHGSLEKELREQSNKGERVPMHRSIDVVDQVGSALVYLHEELIVHQDVKPDNILKPDETTFWLSDLGIIRELKPNDSFAPQPVAFSPHYVSPEQSQGRAQPASDQYSLGITTFRLLTGVRPFDGKSMAEIVDKQRREKPISLSEAVERLHMGERSVNILRALDPVVQTALEKQPDKRHASVTVFSAKMKDAYNNASTEHIFDVFPVAKPKSTDERSNYYFRKEKEYKQAILSDPGDFGAYAGRGFALSKINCFVEANESYNEAIRLNPEDYRLHINKGNVLDVLKRHREALQSYEEAIRLNPKDYRAYNNKGNALDALMQYGEAIQSYDEAIRLNPEDINAYIYKGIILGKLNRHEEELEYCDVAISLNPEDSRTYFYKCHALAALKRYKEALEVSEQFFRTDPSMFFSQDEIDWLKAVQMSLAGICNQRSDYPQ